MKESIHESIVNIVRMIDSEGCNVKSDSAGISDSQLLIEFERTENLHCEYKNEFTYIVNVMRNSVWDGSNTPAVYYPIQRLNLLYMLFGIALKDQFWTLDAVIEYALILFNQFKKMGIPISADLVNKTVDQIQMIRSRASIEEGWKNILESDDGTKAFIDIFDDTFQNGILKYEKHFIKELSEADFYCRMVKTATDDGNRFIPNNAAAINRWNPPGKIFLYMSYSNENNAFDDDLSLCEYICLLECRTSPDTDCSFCYFKPNTKGRILDLSYNDVELSLYRKALADYSHDKVNEIAGRILKECEGQSEHKMREAAQKELKELSLSDEIITVNSVKQVLKMICSAIYKKVDENQEDEYRSFHILSDYLMKQGITGIIYPCTRTNKIKGKNIVLFNKEDASPRVDTIKHYHFNG